ncbi:MAG: phosphoribosylanthranilate isomerase [Pseudomonadota bacterium]
MIRVKICGITRPEDARAAAAAGADAIGLVFHPASPRAVSVAQACAILEALPPFVTSVGLFVDTAPETVAGVLARCPLDLLQFHGDEAPAYCGAFGRPYIKAIRMRGPLDLEALARAYHDARGLLLDAYTPAAAGGTGLTFDWSLIPSGLARPLVLAGGLHPGNVAEAVRRVRPYALDVSSGVEAAPGIKDAALIQAFVANARRAAEDV